MIYDSSDNIPAKIYFKIVESGDLRLLISGDEKPIESDLLKAWSKIENENADTSKKISDVIDISKKIEAFNAKYQAVSLAVHYLKRRKDNDLIEMIKEYGYSLNDETFYNDLKRIETEVDGLLVRIARLQSKLPKPSESEEKKNSFDEVVISYGAIIESGFIDTNSITLNQYNALISVGNRKIKSLQGTINSAKAKRR